MPGIWVLGFKKSMILYLAQLHSFPVEFLLKGCISNAFLALTCELISNSLNGVSLLGLLKYFLKQLMIPGETPHVCKFCICLQRFLIRCAPLCHFQQKCPDFTLAKRIWYYVYHRLVNQRLCIMNKPGCLSSESSH